MHMDNLVEEITQDDLQNDNEGSDFNKPMSHLGIDIKSQDKQASG